MSKGIIPPETNKINTVFTLIQTVHFLCVGIDHLYLKVGEVKGAYPHVFCKSLYAPVTRDSKLSVCFTVYHIKR